jgi:hypothetical protein
LFPKMGYSKAIRVIVGQKLQQIQKRTEENLDDRREPDAVRGDRASVT